MEIDQQKTSLIRKMHNYLEEEQVHSVQYLPSWISNVKDLIYNVLIPHIAEKVLNLKAITDKECQWLAAILKHLTIGDK